MKYIRTYETKEKFLADKDSTSRGFRLKPTLYKYSEAGDHIHLELDDPRKHEGSTYMEITLDSDVEFSFYIGNKSGDAQTTMNCSIDWGDGTVETKTITADDKGFKLSHNYVVGSYSIELYDVERGYSVVGDVKNWKCLISHSSSVKRVVLGDGVEIASYTFYNCTSLTSINIPEGVTSIGKSAFSRCSSLTSINIPEGVTSIGASAFWKCTSLTSINIPEGVTSIGASAFTECSSLTSINIPEGVLSLENMVFQECKSLTSINIPESVTSIKNSTFDSCPKLSSITFPKEMTVVGEYAFRYCYKIKSIYSYNPVAPTIYSATFKSIHTNGILHIKPGATGYDAWLSKLTSGWTIVEDL